MVRSIPCSIGRSIGTIRVVHFKRSAKPKLTGGFEPTPQFRANIYLNPGRPCGRPAVTLAIAVASLLEKLNLKETEKNTILASIADAQLKVCKRPVARLQATVQQKSVVSQRAKCVQWSAPEFLPLVYLRDRAI